MIIRPLGRRCVYPVHHTPSNHLLILDQALARDGFRCVVTGAFDEASMECNPELQGWQRRLDALIAVLETSRIVDEPTTQGIGTRERDAMVNRVCPVTQPSATIRSHLLPRGSALLA